jgi:HAD superfamily hydrolase (TIGR01509 family)
MSAKLIIFDCDGVLVDSEILSNAVLAKSLGNYGYQISANELVRHLRGLKLTDSLEILQNESGITLPDSFEHDLREEMSSVFAAQLLPVEGALRLVKSLRIPFCTASNGPRKKIEENLTTTNLYPHFINKIFSAYEVNSWKPDPDLFLAAAKHFSVALEDCIVIEDSIVGVNAAIAANMTVIALSRSSNNRALDRADKVFTNLNSVYEFLLSKNLARE